MVIGTLVFGRSAYQNAVCLGLIADDRGRKMSKHLGNVLEPMALMDARGADAVRWFFAASGSPWATRKIGDGALEEVVRKILLPYWNTASFLVRYANAAAAQGDAWVPPGRPPGAAAGRRAAATDRWLLSQLQVLVRDTTSALEAFDTAAAGRLIAAFIDDLSRWYVRRSRRRFRAGPLTPDGARAFATLYAALETLTRLMAPITPFITDHLWGVLRGGTPPDSVHLAAWPVPDASLIDAELGAQMALARRLVDLGRAARASAGVRVRQPLARALVGRAGPGRPAGRAAGRGVRRAERRRPGAAGHRSARNSSATSSGPASATWAAASAWAPARWRPRSAPPIPGAWPAPCARPAARTSSWAARPRP